MKIIEWLKNPNKRGAHFMVLGLVIFLIPNFLGSIYFFASTSFFLTFIGAAFFLLGIFKNAVLDQKPVTDKIRMGVWTMYWGAFVAFCPMGLAALATAPGYSMWSEGSSQSGGSILWLMLMTVPAGLILGIVGLVMALSGSSSKSNS